MTSAERKLTSQVAALNARLADMAGEIQCIAEALPYLTRTRREVSRAELAMTCRRLLAEAADLSRLRDRIEAIEDGPDLGTGGMLAMRTG